jgi:hypothetical protein
MDERRGPYRVLMRKHEGKKPIGKPSRVSEDNIKMNIRVVRRENGFIDLSHNRVRWWAVVKIVMTLRVS